MLSDVLDQLSDSWNTLRKSTVDSFIDLECGVDPYTLADHKGALMSMIRLGGSKKLAGPQEFEDIITYLATKMTGSFTTKGHAIQVSFTRDPNISASALEDLMEPARSGAKVSSYDLDDVLDDRERNLASLLAEEDTLICCWTLPEGMNSEEVKRNKIDNVRNMSLWPYSPTAQNVFAGSEILEPRHEGFVQSVVDALSRAGKSLEVELLKVKPALREVRKSIRPFITSPEWLPVLYGDPVRIREPGIATPDDFSTLLWPKLSSQICDTDFIVHDGQTFESDGRLWTSLDMTMAPAEQFPFNNLVATLNKQKVPFRVSFLIEGGGRMSYKRALASFIQFSNAGNKLLKSAIDQQEQRALSNEAIVRLRCSFATWAPAKEPATLRRNVAHLERAIQGWGRAEVTTKTGDPLGALFSTVPGAACTSTGDPGLPALEDAFAMLPLQRPACPMKEGTHIFRSPDGKPWPYKPDTGLSPLVFDLIYAEPGKGKSVLMNSMCLSALLAARTAETPFTAIIDIGRSSSGLISMIKAALPPERQHEAEYIRLTMDPAMAVNPHDTQLGCREPMPSEKSYLEGLYSLLVTAPGEQTSKDMQDLISFVIKQMYRWRSDQTENNEPKKYTKYLSSEVDQTLDQLGLQPDQATTWWEVVDFLFENGKPVLASLAQRFAVPILSDAIAAAQNDRVANIMKNTKENSESIIDVFCRRITASLEQYPLLSSETRFDISNTRICALDLADVSPSGGPEEAQKTAIMYMFARHVLVHHWWFDANIITWVPDLYKKYHEKRVKSLLSMPKRLMYDEFHRTEGISAVRNQVIRDARETRKMNVQLCLASQILGDFTSEMLSLASGIWILGTGTTEDDVNKTVKTFGLNETAKSIVKFDLTGPGKGGAPVLHIANSNKGRYEQILYNSLGATELWALSTTPNDVTLRDELSARVGPARARTILAKQFPAASAKPEIKRMEDDRKKLGETTRAATEIVIADLADELAQAARLDLHGV